MPIRVRVAVLALVVLVVGVVYVTARFPPLALVIGVLGTIIVADLVRGRPSGLWTARWFALGALYAFAALGSSGAAWFRVLPASIVLCVCSCVISLGLAGSSAQRYFDLYCGHCHTTRVRGVGIGFQVVQCRKCGRRWKPHSHRVDPSVFD